jgi:hypothetical protein
MFERWRRVGCDDLGRVRRRRRRAQFNGVVVGVVVKVVVNGDV